ncbi:MAG: ribosomal-processing cysteine protease Prp [Solobacterium sp.]|nr:ribosomal-processing cysteine protease Prp [Solobacterium sp.]
MIRVSIKRRNGIEKISVTGHADAAAYGEDLICAGVSSIAFGLCNALDEMKASADIKIKENSIEIRTDSKDALTQTILETGYYQLKTVSDQYPENMKITEV